MAAGPSTVGPLSLLTQLSRRVYLYRPKAPSAQPASSTPASLAASPATPPAPKLILLATWMGAQDSHIAKYLQPYRQMFPTSIILLVRSEPVDFFVPRPSSGDLAAGVAVLRATFPNMDAGLHRRAAKGAPNGVAWPIDDEAAPRRTPELLIHTWSNGGASQLARLRHMLIKDAPPSANVLPLYTIVMDSAPGKLRYRSTYNAFAMGFPRWARIVFAPVLHAFVSTLFLLTALGRLRLALRKRSKARKAQAQGQATAPERERGLGGGGLLEWGAAANNSRRWLGTELRRTYAYSDTDALILASDIERHAAQAKERGFNVRMEKFIGTPHVAHARMQPERYWRMAQETWEGEPPSKLVEEKVVEPEPEAAAEARQPVVTQPTA